MAPNSDGKRQSACFKFQVAEILGSLAIQGREVGQDEKNCMAFIKTNVETDDVYAVGSFGREFPKAETQKWESLPASMTQFQRFRTSPGGRAGLCHIIQQVETESELRLLVSLTSQCSLQHHLIE